MGRLCQIKHNVLLKTVSEQVRDVKRGLSLFLMYYKVSTKNCILLIAHFSVVFWARQYGFRKLTLGLVFPNYDKGILDVAYQ